MILVFVLYSLFASVFVIAKVGLEYSQPFFFVGSRMLAAGFIMLGYQWLAQRHLFIIKRDHYIRLFALGFFNIYLTNVMEFWGLQYLTAFKTCFIYSLSPFFAAFFSFLVFHERLTRKKWLGLLVGFIGFFPILLMQSPTEELAGGFGVFSWAELAVLVAAGSSAYGWILLRQLVREDGYPAPLVNGWSMLVGGTFALIHSGISETWHPVPVSEYEIFLYCVIALIVISNIFAYNLYGLLLKKFSATFLSFAGFSTPAITALFGWLFIGESITWGFVFCSIVVFLGLGLFYQEELRHGLRIPQKV